jgi:hypothetical protein
MYKECDHCGAILFTLFGRRWLKTWWFCVGCWEMCTGTEW